MIMEVSSVVVTEPIYHHQYKIYSKNNNNTTQHKEKIEERFDHHTLIGKV